VTSQGDRQDVRRQVRARPGARTFQSIALGVAVLSIAACGDPVPDDDTTDPTVRIRLFDSTQSVLYDTSSDSPSFLTAEARFHAELLVSDEGGIQSITLSGQDATLRSDSTTYTFEHHTPSAIAETLRWQGSRAAPIDDLDTEVAVAFRPSSTSLLLRLDASDWSGHNVTTPSIRVDLTTGSIAGVARDALGAVLPGATVTITGEPLIGGPRSVITDASGAYEVANLPPGIYTASYALVGFAPLRREGVVVEPDSTTRLDVELSAVGLR
jgi:hypothetical protein